MRIIKNGACKLQDIQQFKCQICGCVYELDLCNEEIGECPCCHSHKSYQVRFDGDVEESVKAKNPVDAYPNYYNFSKPDDRNVKELTEQETKELIDRCTKLYFKNACGYATVATGDTIVMVTQNDDCDMDDYRVIVSNNYYELDNYDLE